MGRRQVDIRFDAGESLFRAVAKKDIDSGKKVKAQKLRLQISVVRQRFDETGATCLVPTRPKENGIIRGETRAPVMRLLRTISMRFARSWRTS